MQYKTIYENHAYYPDRIDALIDFLNPTINVNGKQTKHKLRHARSSNSEDALTWSCFDALRMQPYEKRVKALNEIMRDSFENMDESLMMSFNDEEEIYIHIGKNYSASINEKTEVDVSFESENKLVFIEAKLYSKISLTSDTSPYDQIIRKLRVGLDVAKRENKQFFLLFLDIAPMNKILKYGEEKAASAKYFKQYKENSVALKDKLIENTYDTLEGVSQNMGWLTWTSLFKIVLRSIISEAKIMERQNECNRDLTISKINAVLKVLSSKIFEEEKTSMNNDANSKRFKLMAQTKLLELIGRL
ncbi:hypothetical protein [Mesoflavibacter zeaxanthinifaciens]|uniref:hypothetical protein n=1 Tax=Mesoflavibacter zeaxanthinifaciens TaxID=393060 RepID=UPI003A92D232